MSVDVDFVSVAKPGGVALLDARLPGMWRVAGSILMPGNILLEIGHEIISTVILSLSLI